MASSSDNDGKAVVPTTTTVVLPRADVLMIGTGEYTTGYVGGTAANSDKGKGVVALTMFDLRRRMAVNRLAMCGVNGRKFPGIRTHLQQQIGDYYADMDVSCETFPGDDIVDPHAYETAIATFRPGDMAIIFTPDDTHFAIAMACIQHGMHVLVTKPIVQTLDEHRRLAAAAQEKNVLLAVEVHKRWDPFYAEARDRIRATDNNLGDFQYLYAYMSQPKHQLETFKAWAGGNNNKQGGSSSSSSSSDISYYLNSHHIDWSEWTLHGMARPIRVTGTASTGVAHGKDMDTEDSITLTVQWENLVNDNDKDNNTATAATAATSPPKQPPRPKLGCAVYTSSWVAPKSDVHSQQRFFYMGSSGEITMDQAHRGCTVATDKNANNGLMSINPLFMKYTPSNGQFAGQNSYGVQSFEHFITACRQINAGRYDPTFFDDGSLATIHTTWQTTAILEAGRLSLNSDGRPMDILYETTTTATTKTNKNSCVPIAIAPHQFAD
jgi:D-galacturonate reductase